MSKTIGESIATEVSTPTKYLGGEVLTPNGSSATCTLPTGTNAVILAANGQDIYYAINASGDAAATSPGFVKDGTHWMVGPLTNLTSLKVFAASGSGKCHLEYYQG